MFVIISDTEERFKEGICRLSSNPFLLRPIVVANLFEVGNSSVVGCGGRKY
jgi:hypothetical protein